MAHALLSPSSAPRWAVCTPSARLEEGYPDKGSIAADEGTLAHIIAELVIAAKVGLGQPHHVNVLKMFRQQELWTADMDDYVEQYATFVSEQFTEAKRTTPDARIFLETRLDMTEWVPEGFGTADVLIVADGTLIFDDLKYGKGVLVSADWNKQLLIYALGAVKKFGFLYDIQRVEMNIYQPRIDNYSTFTLDVKTLLDWGYNLKSVADQAYKGEGEFVVGEHCRFCKAKAVCRAFSEHNMRLATLDFKPSPTLTDAEIAQVLRQVDTLVEYAKAVADYAFTEALAGKKWEGFKLVEGRSNRQYADHKKVVEVLVHMGLSDADIFKPIELLNITAMEKSVGKKAFTEMVAPLLIKPPGKPVLVPDTDKRAEFNSVASAQADFAE